MRSFAQQRHHRNPRLWGQWLLAATLLAPTEWAQTCSTWPTADRFTLNGAEVTDKRTGLNWKRCSEGQNWSGSSCTGTGTASAHTHEAALASAKAANTSQSATGWRLPNVKDLASLADKACQHPAIDGTAFPATPSNLFWASSPYVSYSGGAWYVYFTDGKVYGNYRNLDLHVRFVRASQ